MRVGSYRLLGKSGVLVGLLMLLTFPSGAQATTTHGDSNDPARNFEVPLRGQTIFQGRQVEITARLSIRVKTYTDTRRVDVVSELIGCTARDIRTGYTNVCGGVDEEIGPLPAGPRTLQLRPNFHIGRPIIHFVAEYVLLNYTGVGSIDDAGAAVLPSAVVQAVGQREDHDIPGAARQSTAEVHMTRENA